MRHTSWLVLKRAAGVAVLLGLVATQALAEVCNPATMPSVSISCSEPDANREIDCAFAYSFPNTGSRYLGWGVDGGWHEPRDLESSGVLTAHLGLQCSKPDVHTISALVKSCGSDAAKSTAEKTIVIDPTPSVSISYEGPRDDATGTYYIGYSLPYTGDIRSISETHRNIQVYFDGALVRTHYDVDREGVVTDGFNVGCTADGEHTLKAVATGCSPEWRVEDSTTITVNHRPTVSVSFPYNDTRAVVSYDFTQSPDRWHRYVELRWLETDLRITGQNPVDARGSFEVNLSCPTDKASIVYAMAWGCDDEAKSGPASIPPCKRSCAEGGSPDPLASLFNATVIGPTCECTGDPVDVTSGNMEFVDRDSIPGEVVGPLRRTYHSKNTQAGVFGLGWSSMFDARLKTADGGDTVLLQLDDERRYVFERIANVYKQVFPAGDPRAGTLAMVSGAFRHRIGGSNVYREFRATDGRLGAIGIAGRESLAISYDPTGKPTSVTDSLGRWTWSLAFGSSGFLETISLAGNAEVIWTYAYANGLLQTVTGPAGALWRTYVYNQGRLEVIKDGAGKVMESHTYDSSGRAITSSGPTAEITNIQYGVAGRVPGEWKTTVTTADGGSTHYYTRYIAGRMRIVEIDGECHCASEDAVFARDENGFVVREQDVRGYITVRTYAGGRAQTVGRYRPASCDPETATGEAPCRLTPDALATVPLVAAPLAF